MRKTWRCLLTFSSKDRSPQYFAARFGGMSCLDFQQAQLNKSHKVQWTVLDQQGSAQKQNNFFETKLLLHTLEIASKFGLVCLI